MGSQNSRPKLTRVAPSDSRAKTGVDQKEPEASQCTAHWSTGLQEKQQDTVGISRVTQLPPLKQEVPLVFPPIPADPLLGCHSASMGQSIIQSHPPRRTQRLQPLVRPMAGVVLEGTDNSKAKECRVGAAQHSSTHNQGRCYGTGSLQQEGVLEAQVILGAQAYSQRRAHRRRAQELHRQRQQRRAARVVVNSNGMDGNGNQFVQLVKRHGERNVFWDGLSGENIVFEDLFRPNTGCPERQKADTSQTDARNFLGDESLLLEDPPKYSSKQSHVPRMSSLDDRVTVPWMLDWEGSKQGHQSPRRSSSQDIQSRHRFFSQGEKTCWDRNRTSIAVDEWEFIPQISEDRKQCGRQNRTRAEAIPSFENHLGFDFDDEQI